MPIVLKYRKLHPEALSPKRWTNASGWNIYAHLISDSHRPNTLVLPPRYTRVVPTAIMVEPPTTHFILLCSLPEHARRSVFVLGHFDLEGLQVLLYNGSHETQYLKHQDQIARLHLLPIVDITLVETVKPREELTDVGSAA